VEGWITNETARKLFDFEALKKSALSKQFKPVPLPWRGQVQLQNTIRRIESQNVLAKLEGSDPKQRDEYVIYMAHWDHLGIGPPDAKGDNIYNGALDNASGTAALLQLAGAYAKLPKAPRRSLLFLAVTAEEQGLIGSEYYASFPLYPLKKTAAVINMDGMNLLGRTRDIVVIGLGMSTLDDDLRAVARLQERRVEPDAEPEKGFYYRSDHFSFAKQGVPALNPGEGVDYTGRPPGWGMQMRERYTNDDYHKPSDEVKPDWDLSGAIQDIELYYQAGSRVANSTAWPQWKPGTEFKAKRDAMMK
jgi:Zn-dependent M28 family amino/carboxypeptidase